MAATNFFQRFRNVASINGYCLSSGTFEFSKSKLSARKTQFWLCIPPNATQVIVWLHGAGDHGLFPGFFIQEAILNHGYGLFTFDLPGHGPQSTSTFCESALQGCVDDAIAKLLQIARFDHIHVLGNSFGGAIALANLATSHNKIQKLILLGVPLTPSVTKKAAVCELIHLVDLSTVRLMYEHGVFAMLPALGRFKRTEFPIRLPDGYANKPFSYVDYVSDAITHLYQSLPNESNNTTSALGIYGEYDRIAPIADGMSLLSRFKNHKFACIKGKSHYTVNFSNEAICEITGFLSTR